LQCSPLHIGRVQAAIRRADTATTADTVTDDARSGKAVQVESRLTQR
jgi:hypothetical protein